MAVSLLCHSLTYQQKAEELKLELDNLHEEREQMNAKVSELQMALQGHQQVTVYIVSLLWYVRCEKMKISA